MNWLLLFIGGFMGFFFVLVPGIALVVWVLSYNRYAVVLKEVGEDENDAIIKFVRCKVVNNSQVGEIIKFFPFSGLGVCKRFDSNAWTSIKYKNRLVEGIILFCQGQNFRPVRLEKEAGSYLLNVKDEDNRRFLMQYEIMLDKRREEMGLVRFGVIGFFMTLIVVGVVGLFVVLFIMDEGTKQYFLYQGAELIVK